MSSERRKGAKAGKGTKRELIFADVALIILGLIMVIFPDTAKDIICIAIGVILGVWGILRLISYFVADKASAFGSFGLVQGAALLGFGVLFILKPEFLEGLLLSALAIILIISGVLKLQYAVDFLRLKARLWWLSLVGAVAVIALGAVVFFNLSAAASWLMMFIGISFLLCGAIDIAAVVALTNVIKSANDPSSIEVEAEEIED